MWITNPSCDGANFVANTRDGSQTVLFGQFTDSMLPLPFYREWHQTNYDPRAPEECINIDDVTDQYGDTCTDYYDANPSTCSYYDTRDFTSTELCCACGGGQKVEGSRLVDKISG